MIQADTILKSCFLHWEETGLICRFCIQYQSRMSTDHMVSSSIKQNTNFSYKNRNNCYNKQFHCDIVIVISGVNVASRQGY